MQNVLPNNMNDLIVFQYGILGEILSNNKFSVIHPFWEETLSSYVDFFKKYDLLPVCHVKRSSSEIENIFQFFEVNNIGTFSSILKKENEIHQKSLHFVSSNSSFLNSVFKTHFYLGALRYHLCALVKAYVKAARIFSNTLKIPVSQKLQEKKVFLKRHKLSLDWISDVPVVEINVSTLGTGNSEPIFYEMMAYLTSSRSLLDALMHVIRTIPDVKESGKSPPKSFREFMDKIQKNEKKYHVSASITKYLIENWYWLSNLIEYRNCIIHEGILSRTELPSVSVVHSDHKILALFAWLPDNPKERSINKFTFNNHIEYLSYAHKTYLQLVELYRKVLNFINS